MRFVKQHLESISGVEIYPIISLLIFFFFFVALAWYAFKVDKTFVSYMKNRPLDITEDEDQPKI